MSHDAEAIVEQLSGLLGEFTDKSGPFGASTDLIHDLGMESVHVMEFLGQVEDHYDIAISLTDLADKRTLGELAEHVKALLAVE